MNFVQFVAEKAFGSVFVEGRALFLLVRSGRDGFYR
jgi:hypothetical protein